MLIDFHIKNKLNYVAISALETLAQMVIILFIINILEATGVSYLVITKHMFRSEAESGIAVTALFMVDLMLCNVLFNWTYYRKDAIVMAFVEALAFIGIFILSMVVSGISGILEIGISGFVLLLFTMFYSLALENFIAKKLRSGFSGVS